MLTAEAERRSVLGVTVPRLFTPPLVALTRETSYGFSVIDFARDVLKRPLDPWQEWVVVHAGELLPDGRPRFRIVLLLVARQQGKTELLVILSLYWMYLERQELILGTSTKLDYARESWNKAVKLARQNPDLNAEIPRDGERKSNGEQAFKIVDPGTLSESRYKISASNEEGGRSLSIDRLVCDELRQHHDWSAWGAGEGATNARPYAQIWGLSNQGDDRAVVLNSFRKDALEYIETGEGDYRLGLIEYSAPDGSRPTDVHALAQSTPNLGRRTDIDSLYGAAIRAENAGGEQLTTFQTEYMCMKVSILDPAIDPTAWANSRDIDTMDALRDRLALCIDVSMDGLHASLVAAAVMDPDPPRSDDGPDATPVSRVRVEAIKAWSGPLAMRHMQRDLPALVKRIKPRVVGWFPQGPAASVAAALVARNKRSPSTAWPPPGVLVEEIRKDTAAVCMGLATHVLGGQIAQPGDPMLDKHIGGASRLWTGATWVFTRKGEAYVDGAYATAGAVHLARTLPPPPARPMLVVTGGRRRRSGIGVSNLGPV